MNSLSAISLLMMTMTDPHLCEQVTTASYLTRMKETARNGIKLFGNRFFGDNAGEVGMVIEVAIGLTILLIVLGYVFAPVGLTAFQSTNRSAAGVAAGTTNGNIWDAIVPIALASLILSVVMVIKKVSA